MRARFARGGVVRSPHAVHERERDVAEDGRGIVAASAAE